MFDQLTASFSQSPQGQQAYQQLTKHGFAGPQAATILNTAVPAAAEAMQGAARGEKLPSLGESSYVMNFAAAAVSGLIRGQGFMGSAMDGLQGVVGGYVAHVIAARCGLPKRTAGLVGAVITPMAIDFLWDKLQGQRQPAPQVPAAPPPAQLPPAGYAAPGYGPPGYAAAGYGYAHQTRALPPGGYARPPAPPPTYQYNPYTNR
jgi:hypothetical protein